ncbi:MAG: glycosyltransferase 87 family protein, partial [Chloroflexota bacterium]|nr:glycosyltransferase 87 family protein [Chloroflexota bacterium]
MTILQTERAGEIRQTLAWVRAAGVTRLPEAALWGSLARPLLLVLFGLAGGVAVSVWASFTMMLGKPVDAWCYYRIAPGAPYWQTDYAFVYSPAAAQAMIPFQALSFEVFVGLIRAAELAAAFALAGPLLPLVILLPPVASEINAANINLLIVAVAVWGLRWPALWSLVLLTKVTPGVGLVWFAVRREWRNLAIALGVTGAIVVASFLYAPGLWFEWPAYMTTLTPSDGVPLWARMVGAAALVAWGARTNRPWT